jgi:hypothetical protein
MAAEDYTPERLMHFLRQSTIEGLLNPAVAKSRLNAVEQLFVELTEQERADIRLIDVDKLSLRLHKIQDSSIRPEVVMLYNKRVSAALTDYLSWLDNPKSFASIGGDSFRKDKRYQATEKEVSREQKALEEITLTVSERAPDIVSIPLRDDRTIFIQNLPLDLTEYEAARIAKVIQALAQPSSQEDQDED